MKPGRDGLLEPFRVSASANHLDVATGLLSVLVPVHAQIDSRLVPLFADPGIAPSFARGESVVVLWQMRRQPDGTLPRVVLAVTTPDREHDVVAALDFTGVLLATDTVVDRVFTLRPDRTRPLSTMTVVRRTAAA